MNWDAFLTPLLGAACGGVAAWVAIRVDVAIARKIAEDAAGDAEKAHTRLDDHIERHHTRAGQ